MKLKLRGVFNIEHYLQIELRLFVETRKSMRSFPLFGIWFNKRFKTGALILFGINFTIQSYW